MKKTLIAIACLAIVAAPVGPKAFAYAGSNTPRDEQGMTSADGSIANDDTTTTTYANQAPTAYNAPVYNRVYTPAPGGGTTTVTMVGADGTQNYTMTPAQRVYYYGAMPPADRQTATHTYTDARYNNGTNNDQYDRAAAMQSGGETGEYRYTGANMGPGGHNAGFDDNGAMNETSGRHVDANTTLDGNVY